MLYTVQMAAISRMPDHIEPIDITIKSSIAPWNTFAPTWVMVEGFKDGSINEAEYKKRYLAVMRNRYKENREPFKKLVEKALSSDIALACYCPSETFCHRMLLVDILLKIEPKLIYMGEAVAVKKDEQLTLF